VQSGVSPLTVQFTGTANDEDGTVEIVFWDFGDGQRKPGMPGGLTANNVYVCPGDYTAVLGVIDNDGLVSQAKVDIHVLYSEGTSASFSCDLELTFSAFCAWCHFPKSYGSPAADLDVTSYAAVMEGAYGGTVPVVIPGEPNNSSIYTRVGINDQCCVDHPLYPDDPPRPEPCGDMHPVPYGGEPATTIVKEQLKLWIQEGALDN
jgi:PKD repeat protein